MGMGTRLEVLPWLGLVNVDCELMHELRTLHLLVSVD